MLFNQVMIDFSAISHICKWDGRNHHLSMEMNNEENNKSTQHCYSFAME